jgi:hypothetical protein
MTKTGIFTFFAGCKNSPKDLFLNFTTEMDVNLPKNPKNNTRKWVIS